MGQVQNCTTRGTGSDTHAGPTWKSVSTTLRGSTSKPTALPPGGPTGRERAGHRAPPLFKAERRPQEARGSVVSTLPSQGSQATGGSREAVEGERELRPRYHNRDGNSRSQR